MCHRNAAGENDLFQIAAFLQKIVDNIAVGNAYYILLDDRAIVQNLRYVVAGRANELDSSLKRLVIGLCSHESRQKRMMNVDDAGWVLGHKLRRENLHVARQHNEVRIVLLEYLQNLLLRCLLLARRNWNYDKGNLVKSPQILWLSG